MLESTQAVSKLHIAADELVHGLLKLSETEHIAILDSCGIGHLGSHLLIGGIGAPIPSPTLEDLVDGDRPTVFTLSYSLGAKLNGIRTGDDDAEPEIYALSFESLIIYDYITGETHVVGDSDADS